MVHVEGRKERGFKNVACFSIKFLFPYNKLTSHVGISIFYVRDKRNKSGFKNKTFI